MVPKGSYQNQALMELWCHDVQKKLNCQRRLRQNSVGVVLWSLSWPRQIEAQLDNCEATRANELSVQHSKLRRQHLLVDGLWRAMRGCTIYEFQNQVGRKFTWWTWFTRELDVVRRFHHIYKNHSITRVFHWGISSYFIVGVSRLSKPGAGDLRLQYEEAHVKDLQSALAGASRCLQFKTCRDCLVLFRLQFWFRAGILTWYVCNES